MHVSTITDVCGSCPCFVGCSPALIPNKVAPTLNKCVDDIHGNVQAESRYHHGGSTVDYGMSTSRITIFYLFIWDFGVLLWL